MQPGWRNALPSPSRGRASPHGAGSRSPGRSSGSLAMQPGRSRSPLCQGPAGAPRLISEPFGTGPTQKWPRSAHGAAPTCRPAPLATGRLRSPPLLAGMVTELTTGSTGLFLWKGKKNIKITPNSSAFFISTPPHTHPLHQQPVSCCAYLCGQTIAVRLGNFYLKLCILYRGIHGPCLY